MIIQENEFLKMYDEMNSLWEATKPTVVNGVELILKREFQSPQQVIDRMPKRISGIYLIKYKCPEYGAQYYVGKSVDIKYRTHVHFNRCPTRDSKLLHNKIREHYNSTPERFSIAILEDGLNGNELGDREKFWIKKLNTYRPLNETNGLNLTTGGDGGGHPKVTVETHAKIVYDLKNTTNSYAAIAKERGTNRWTVSDINEGDYFLSDGDTKYPIRSKETVQAIKVAAWQARIDKDKAEHAIPYIVYKDTDKNYYYFPSSTEAGEWAYTKELYKNSSTNAREQIKKNINRNNRFFELLDDFVRSARVSCWGALNTVPDEGFKGTPVYDASGNQLGIKLDIVSD